MISVVSAFTSLKEVSLRLALRIVAVLWPEEQTHSIHLMHKEEHKQLF